MTDLLPLKLLVLILALSTNAYAGNVRLTVTATGSVHNLANKSSGSISSVYGFGEMFCGDIGHAVACDSRATTASGLPFDPTYPMAAIAAPTNMALKAQVIGLQVAGGKCQAILLADKMHPKWIGVRGFDLTPAAVTLLTGKPATKYWKDRVFVCQLPPPRGKIRKSANHGRYIPARP
jgi:hypothetical protein